MNKFASTRTFSLEALNNTWVRDLIDRLLAENNEPLRVVDLISATIEADISSIVAAIEKNLLADLSIQDLLMRLSTPYRSKSCTLLGGDQPQFTLIASQALAECEANLAGLGLAGEEVAAELLTACLLIYLEEEVPDASRWLDADGAAVALMQYVRRETSELPCTDTEEVESALQDSGNDETSPPLPRELGPSIDLTTKLVGISSADPPAFSGEAVYERVFEAFARTFHRRKARHVLLVGERGVGQSAILAELARRGASGEISLMKDKRVVSIDARFVSSEESRQRLAGILDYATSQHDWIVCVESFAKLLRGPAGTNNIPLLLSALSGARCYVVGLLSPQEYEELVSDDPDMQEFFVRVDLDEPDVEVAHKLLRHYAAGLEQQFQVELEPKAVERAVVLSANYMFSERLPTKAVKILQRVCEDVDYERSQHGSTRNRVTVDDVIAAVSVACGVPEGTLRGIAERSDYEKSLGTYIVGQPHAVSEVAGELGLIKAGLCDPGKPASVMLLVGQTGTGKTEMAKALARFYSTSGKLKTYTLGNFVEPHSVAGIIGVPPGYVGHDTGGRLINDLNADPYSVVLLDEADKAHPDVLQPFLNVFDEGWVVDQRGVKAYADRSIFLLTTNVGQKMIADMAAKGNSPDEIATRIKEALSQIKHGKSNRPVFAPEFLARIKRVIVFNPLDHEAMEGICRNLIRQMQQNWQVKRQKTLDISELLIQQIAKLSHERNAKSKGKEGGRIVRKLISDLIELKVQRAISDRVEEYKNCQTVAVRFQETTQCDDESGNNTDRIEVAFV